MGTGQTDSMTAISARSAKMDSGSAECQKCHIPLGYGTGTNPAQPAQPPAAPPKTAPASNGGADSASVAPEPQSNTAMAATTKRRRKLRMERQDRSDAKEKRDRGRPARYRGEDSDLARKLALEGYSHKFVAFFFGVSLVTIYQWQKRYPRFKKALDRGRKKRN
jgi:hypothetical protein